MYYGWVGNYAHNNTANRAASDAESAARRAENAMVMMQDAMDRQSLVLRTILTACEKKGLFNEAEFRELMNEIDLSDGKLDGKYKPQAAPRDCPKCGKRNGKRAITCMYCGAELTDREIV